MRELIALRRELLRERTELEESYSNASPAVRAEALQQWREDNAERIHEMRSLANNPRPE